MFHPKCPKCERSVASMHLATVNGVTGGTAWKTVLFCCPHCHSILSANIDPIAVKGDIVAEVVNKVAARLGR